MGNYLLLLNYIFHDYPRWLNEIVRLYPEPHDFAENLEKYLALKDTKEQDRFRKKYREFDLSNYKARLTQQGINFITLFSPDYPPLLRQIDDPPIVLFYRGELQHLLADQIGMVGTRVPTAYGAAVTKTLARELANYFVITSGLALGIDTIAHQAALEQERPTVAVVATGLDTIYPTANIKLFQQITQKGVVVSEYPLGATPVPFHFPQRNRIISGLSKGIVVCEAPEKSGALITAKHALEQNREIFAIPGSILTPQALGCHRLIQDGAKLVHCLEDIMVEFNLLFKAPRHKTAQCQINLGSTPLPTQPQESPPLEMTSEEKTIWDTLSTQPKQIEDIVTQSQKPIHQVLQTLTFLEINDYIQQLPGKYFQRIS